MTSFHVKTAVAILAGLLLIVPAKADDRIMPGLTAQWIARDMEINGLPASMQTITGNRSLDEVLRYYRRAWSGAIDERQEGPWTVIATRQGDQFISLRLQGFGRSVRGVLTVSLDPEKATPNSKSELGIPPNLQKLGHQIFRDRGSRGENLTLMSRRSVPYERQAFASLYENDGWTKIEDRTTQSVHDGHVMTFLHGKKQVRVVLYRDPDLADGSTLILVTAHHD